MENLDYYSIQLGYDTEDLINLVTNKAKDRRAWGDCSYMTIKLTPEEAEELSLKGAHLIKL